MKPSFKLITIASVIFLTLISVTIVKSDYNSLIIKGNPNNLDKYNIKNSGYWVLSPITIDGDESGVGAHNWTWAESQAWCSGSGTFDTPYVIENVTINGNNMTSCIDIRDSDVYFEIYNCTLYNSSSGPPGNSYAGIRLYNVTKGKLIKNNCSNNTFAGIHLISSDNNTVIENTLTNNEMGLKIRFSNDNTASDNKVACNDIGITLENSLDNEVSKNVVENCSWTGIYMVGSHNNTFLENTVTNCSAYGIGMTGSNDNNIHNNTCEENRADGINLYSSHFTNITENTLKNNALNGIHLYTSDNSTITDNGIIWNGEEGISLDSSNNSVVMDNILLNNRGCILEVNCENNFFENNTCVPFDDTDPVLVLFSPQFDDLFGENAPACNITINEDHLNSTWYTLDDGTTILVQSFDYSPAIEIYMINQTLWDVMQDGPVNLAFYANDSSGNMGSTFIDVAKDTIAPQVSINSPSQNGTFGVDAPSYSININEANLDAIWYTLDGGVTNITITGTTGTIDQSIWDSFGNGNVTIRFYASDFLGNIGFQEVTVNKEIPPADPGETQSPAIGGYEVFLLIGIICIGTVIWTKKHYK